MRSSEKLFSISRLFFSTGARIASPPKIYSCVRGRDFKACKSRIISHVTNFSQQPTDSHSLSRAVRARNDGVCWQCKTPVTRATNFACNECHSILPPSPSMNYFDVFELKQNFDLSTAEVQKKFKDLQRNFHPDKFSLKSKFEIEISEVVSSLVNKAYNTLLNPLSRGVYMLELNGVYIDENTQEDDPEFLMEVMELNEEIADAEGSENLIEIRNQILRSCQALVIVISNSIQNNELSHAKSNLIRLRYLVNMTDKLKGLIPPS